MTLFEHESYAKELLSSCADDHPEIESLTFVSKEADSRNASNAMTAILCHRLVKKSGHQATRRQHKTYKWKKGTFNSRNIADRANFWSNLRLTVADVMHDYARNEPVAYLLASWNPSGNKLSVWALPEPLLYDGLSSLPEKESGRERSIEILTEEQRVRHYAASPDLAPYFQDYPLSQQELLILTKAREVDDLAKQQKKRERATTGVEEEPDIDVGQSSAAAEYDASRFLQTAQQQLTEEGVFDPSGISDARKRVFSSIVRRRGQPAFRRYLLAAYGGRCAITGCALEAVLEAAHIIPYRGPKTNHTSNGLLLRTDLHTLFDLKLVAIDVKSKTLLVSQALAGTCSARLSAREDRFARASRAQLVQSLAKGAERRVGTDVGLP